MKTTTSKRVYILYIPCEAGDVCARAWGGMSVEFNWGWIDSSEKAEKAKECLIINKIVYAHWNYNLDLKEPTVNI